MIENLLPYHQKILERASEENPNNARTPTSPSKGYRECLERGWIEEQKHPHSDYFYYALTELGQIALRTKPSTRVTKSSSRLKPMPPRLAILPSRLGSMKHQK